MKRNGVDCPFFEFDFSHPLSKDRITSLNEIKNKEQLEAGSTETLVYRPNNTYAGQFVMKDLVKFANKSIFRKPCAAFMVILVAIRTQAPNVIRQWYGDFYFGNNVLDILLTVTIQLTYVRTPFDWD
jgi:hypothetical protein